MRVRAPKSVLQKVHPLLGVVCVSVSPPASCMVCKCPQMRVCREKAILHRHCWVRGAVGPDVVNWGVGCCGSFPCALWRSSGMTAALSDFPLRPVQCSCVVTSVMLCPPSACWKHGTGDPLCTRLPWPPGPSLHTAVAEEEAPMSGTCTGGAAVRGG